MRSDFIKNKVPEYSVKILASLSIILIVFIFVFIFIQAWPVISASGAGLVTQSNFDTQISAAFSSPESNPVLNFGLLSLIAGTFITTGMALVLAAILGVGGAVAIVEFAPRPLAAALKAMVRLFASIPSVVFGLIGIVAVVPFIEDNFITTQMQLQFITSFQMTGRCLLASVVVLTFMIVPTVISLSVDALESVPMDYKETGFAFGMSHFRVVSKIMLPTARSGIIASIILAAGRGIGEAIAVSMVCGGVGITPDFTRGLSAFLAPVLPLASAIVNKSEAMSSAPVKAALFSCAAILLVIGALFSICAKLIERRLRKAAGYVEQKQKS